MNMGHVEKTSLRSTPESKKRLPRPAVLTAARQKDFVDRQFIERLLEMRYVQSISLFLGDVMKLIAEKVSKNESKPWLIFVQDDQGKHNVDLSIYDIYLTPNSKTGEVELSILRPSGILDRLFGEHKRLYLCIKSSSGGKSVKRWLWSNDQGHSWGPVKKMNASKVGVIDTLTVKVAPSTGDSQ